MNDENRACRENKNASRNCIKTHDFFGWYPDMDALIFSTSLKLSDIYKMYPVDRSIRKSNLHMLKKTDRSQKICLIHNNVAGDF